VLSFFVWVAHRLLLMTVLSGEIKAAKGLPRSSADSRKSAAVDHPGVACVLKLH